MQHGVMRNPKMILAENMPDTHEALVCPCPEFVEGPRQTSIGYRVSLPANFITKSMCPILREVGSSEVIDLR